MVADPPPLVSPPLVNEDLRSTGGAESTKQILEDFEQLHLVEAVELPTKGDALANAEARERAPIRTRPRRARGGNADHTENAALDGFGRFLRQAAQIRLLTHEQEIALAQQLEAGGHEAVNRLIEANIRLVVSVAEPLARVTRLPLEDLVQEGVFGLRRAAEKFDWRRGYKFSTYATWWILQAMRRFIAGQRHTLHMSSHIHDQIGQVKRTARCLVHDLGRDPTELELAAALGLPPQKVSEVLLLSQDAVPLDAPVCDGEDSRSREEMIQDTTLPSPEEETIRNERRAQLDEVLSRFLAPRERAVLCLLVGYPVGTPLTLTEVADQFGISPDMVKRIQATALAKLRSRVVMMMLRDFLDGDV